MTQAQEDAELSAALAASLAPTTQDAEITAALAASLHGAPAAEEDAEITAALAASLLPPPALPPIDDMALAEALSASLQESYARVPQVDPAAPAEGSSASSFPVATAVALLEPDASIPMASAAPLTEGELGAALRAAFASEGVEPLAPVPSIASRQRSREKYPAFTPVPAAAVRGVSTEAEYAQQEGSVLVPDPSPPPVAAMSSAEVRALVSRVEAEEAEVRATTERGPTFSCGVCLEEDVPLLAGHRLEGCGHTFCIECLAGHVRVKVGERAVGAGGPLTPAAPRSILAGMPTCLQILPVPGDAQDAYP